jgi:hypothetical protein
MHLGDFLIRLNIHFMDKENYMPFLWKGKTETESSKITMFAHNRIWSICKLHKQDDQIKEAEIGRACSMR